ncbi:xin actin-binding repeat-containing protein 1-like [Phycodurus eques]|uniref:xin actin-binding repeat-containing protein 1-like n=1 Tax=Phycodurus eques TaxID=693459 RepID=UPI002ACDB6D9|nr:xin actin-binding repeat-containing protein 1-like [Phycodurus eques]
MNGPQENKAPQLQPPKTINDKWERSLPEICLSRSKSMGNLQNNSNGSIGSLKARFESRNKPASNFKLADEVRPSRDAKPVMDGEIKKLAGEQKAAHPSKSDAKEGNAPQKVVMQTQTERKKTIGGTNVERTVISEADEKQRSVADFRENSFVQEREKLCVSVKALSALYLSKVATQEAKLRVLKPAQDQPSETGKQVKQIKMAEESLLKREDHCRLGPEDNPETQSQQFLLSQTCKERLYQQRQKCELRRLLKHTHPELKMLDEVVDEELAEVLSSETEVTADETGYEGEVRSRRLIFENCSQSDKLSVYTPKMHMSEEIVEKSNISKTSAVFEHPDKRPSVDQTVASSPKPSKECEEDVIRIDVQATRKIFESPCVDTPQSSPDNVQGKVFTPGALTGLVQKQGREKCDHQNLQHQEKSSNVNWTEQPKQRLCDFNHSTVKVDDESSSLEVKEEHKDSIKPRASLMQNNPFISKNIEHFYAHMAKPKITADDDCAAKVKNKAHLFESMPFDKIRHQNKDETMVEALKESLSFLHHFNVIHADGSIIEVNETMRAKKAKYALSESGAEIIYNEVSEGNFQNLILRVLPRANLKPQVTYLTEACSGGIKRTLVNVPVHPHQFTGRQDTKCNTANVVQLVEDILNQDNSLRKGAIIQEVSDKSADIIVYSLHKYCPREYLARANERISPLISPDSICQESVSPEVTMKRFKSCIEKADLEDLETLQAKSVVEEQEVPLKQMMGQCTDTDPEQRGDLADEDSSEKQHGEEEIVFQGKLKSALDSLEKSNINVTRGDFKAAMIYRNSSKPSKEIVKNAAVFPDKTINQDVCALASQTQVCPKKVIEAGTSTANAKSISPAPQKSRRPVGPKPTIPPKPDHLKIKLQKKHSNNTENSLKLLIDKNYTDTAKQTEIMSKINTGIESEHDVVSHRRLGEGLQNPQDFPKQQLHGSLIPMGKNDKDNLQGEIKEPAQRKVFQDILIKEKMTETEEAHLDFNEACKKLGSTNDLPKKRPLIKPKRVKIAQCDNQMSTIPAQVGAEPQPPLLCAVIQGNKKDAKDEQEIKQEGKVELRAKKGRTETEDERRQRLSVHMDEILRGNTEAAVEIFDNLRKQEELRGILSRVEEIGEDTSKVDVRSLRKVFENVPDWVVPSNKKKLKQVKAEHKEETKTPLATASKSSMAHVFGDLERASEEIMTLKEQTLARLVDIEEAIKKALYSVSTLKSESDITGLSCLFKESLGSVQRSPASGNISRISIGSGKMASLQIKEDPTAPPGGQNASAERTPKFREGPQCTPAFISIQSASRKSDKPEPLPKETTICPTCQHSPEKFRSAKLFQCNGPALNREEPADCFPQREISVLEVQTDLEGSRILGTKTVTENYERTETHGNRIYSSTTSTVVTTQPETKTSITDLKPALHQLATYPEVLLPVNQNP